MKPTHSDVSGSDIACSGVYGSFRYHRMSSPLQVVGVMCARVPRIAVSTLNTQLLQSPDLPTHHIRSQRCKMSGLSTLDRADAECSGDCCPNVVSLSESSCCLGSIDRGRYKWVLGSTSLKVSVKVAKRFCSHCSKNANSSEILDLSGIFDIKSKKKRIPPCRRTCPSPAKLAKRIQR
jgi:hypothetical protein